uniref:Uncharacterized protein n=1 Tax=Melopsittacus undulatus TaxID=13146 RepID=A0A8V5HCZ5_MELUD
MAGDQAHESLQGSGGNILFSPQASPRYEQPHSCPAPACCRTVLGWGRIQAQGYLLPWSTARFPDFHPSRAEHPLCWTLYPFLSPLLLSIPSFADCCVHCILSCLFCEFLTLCNIVLDCATCGSCTSEDSCICCCCCNSGECADCDLPCDMDCGIIDACCESADCLEICMECCGLCFSS